METSNKKSDTDSGWESDSAEAKEDNKKPSKDPIVDNIDSSRFAALNLEGLNREFTEGFEGIGNIFFLKSLIPTNKSNFLLERNINDAVLVFWKESYNFVDFAKHPLSRRSDNKGRLLVLDSTLRLSCDKTIIGTLNSLANNFRFRVMRDNYCTRLSLALVSEINCR